MELPRVGHDWGTEQQEQAMNSLADANRLNTALTVHPEIMLHFETGPLSSKPGRYIWSDFTMLKGNGELAGSLETSRPPSYVAA